VFLAGLVKREQIAKLTKELREIIDPDISLLRNLTSMCDLTVEERDKISSCATVHEEADELLRWLAKDFTGDYGNVKEALIISGQEHVVNFIIANGGISSQFLLMSD
jgi:hypothetical protein